MLAPLSIVVRWSRGPFANPFCRLAIIVFSVTIVLVLGRTPLQSAPLDVAPQRPLVDLEPLQDIADVENGFSHTCVLTNGGGVKCWGLNNLGQLGDGTAVNRSTPIDVVGLGSGVNAIDVGYHHACVLLDGGSVKCWGHNGHHQLGDGTTTDRSVPVEVTGVGNDVVAVAAGGHHTCVLTNSGGVKCWGWNDKGQLGDGTLVERSTPVDVVGLSSGVKAIAATGHSTCALTDGGGVKCWGDNQWVQLGDGTSTNRSTPVDVIGLSSGVQAVTVAGHHTCALLDSGDVKCWGFNYGGEVGDGASFVFRSTPVDVVGLSSGVSAVAAGGAHTCALLNSGGVKCWGWNNFNQLGDGTSTNRLTPVDVVGLSSGVRALGPNMGNNQSCVLMSNGGVKCWGLNDYSQLGDGTTTNRSTPIDVLYEQTAQPPTLNAAFSWSPEAAHEGSAVQFTDLSTSASGMIQSWQWHFAGLGTSGSQHPTFTFPDSGLHNVCLTVATAGGLSYNNLEFIRNSPYPDGGTTPWPRGDVTLGGVPFHIPQTDPVIWNTHDPYLTGPNPRPLDIALNQSDVQRVYTLINTFGGQPGPAAHAWLEFWGSEGAYYRKDLVGNSDIRDYNFDGWTNGINETTTVNVFLHSPGVYNGERRLDMQIIDLPSAFQTQTLTQIRLSDNGDGNFQRVFLVGITVQSEGDTATPGTTDTVCRNVVIGNVAPTATFAVLSAVQAGQPARFVFSDPVDPSPIDTAAGFLYSYDCTNDGTFELVDSGSPFHDCIYPAVGSITGRGRIKDKDGDFTDYTTVVEVMPQFVIVTESL